MEFRLVQGACQNNIKRKKHTQKSLNRTKKKESTFFVKKGELVSIAHVACTLTMLKLSLLLLHTVVLLKFLFTNRHCACETGKLFMTGHHSH